MEEARRQKQEGSAGTIFIQKKTFLSTLLSIFLSTKTGRIGWDHFFPEVSGRPALMYPNHTICLYEGKAEKICLYEGKEEK